MSALTKRLNLIILFLFLAISIVLSAFCLGNANSCKNSWKSNKIVSVEGVVASYVILQLDYSPSYAYVNIGGVYDENLTEVSLTFNVSEDNLVSGKVTPNGNFVSLIENNNLGWVQILSTPVNEKIVKFSVKNTALINEIVFLDSDKNLINCYALGEYTDPKVGYKMFFDYKENTHALVDAQNSFTESVSRFNKLSTLENDLSFSSQSLLNGGGYVSNNISPLGVILNSIGLLIFKNSVFGARFITFLFALIGVVLIFTLIYSLLKDKNQALILVALSIVSAIVVVSGFFVNPYTIALPFFIVSIYFIIKIFQLEFSYLRSLIFILLSGVFSSFAIAVLSQFFVLTLAEIILLAIYVKNKVDKTYFSRVLLVGLIGYLFIPVIFYLFSTFFTFSIYAKAYNSSNILYLTYKNFIKTFI